MCWQVYMLVDRFGENLQKELMMQLYCDHTFKQLMSVSGDQPPPRLSARRLCCQPR